MYFQLSVQYLKKQNKKKTCHITQKQYLGRMCAPVFHVIVSASVFLSGAFLVRKALLHPRQPMDQNKAAEEQVGPQLQKRAYNLPERDHGRC